MREFITADVYLAAAICTLTKHTPTLSTTGKQVHFHFPAIDEVYKVSSEFNSVALQVPVRAFVRSFVALKKLMYAELRDGEK